MVASFQQQVSVVIHAASSINLKHSLARLAPTVIRGTLNTAEFAQGCTSLKTFAYISTAYANSHLHYLSPAMVPHISESIHPLEEEANSNMDVDTEWSYLQDYGTTPQYQTTPFPFAYAYAKHLTERLLMRKFNKDRATPERSASLRSSTSSPIDPTESTTENAPKLLIIRPSIIGPAETSPACGWQVATSAPVTSLLAFLMLTPAMRLVFYSALEKPERDAIIDEVPVDIVVNRILLHTATGTEGIVHANNPLSACHSFGTYARSVQKLRRLPWDSKFVWDNNAASPKLCKISQLYQISGCTFNFDDGKTRALWKDMAQEDRGTFPLFTSANCGIASGNKELDLSSRHEALKEICGSYLKRKQWPQWLLPLLL